MKPLSEVAPGVLVVQIQIQAVWIKSLSTKYLIYNLFHANIYK